MSHIVNQFSTLEIHKGEEKLVLVVETPITLSDLVDDFDSKKFKELIEEARNLMEMTGHDSVTVRNVRDA